MIALRHMPVRQCTAQVDSGGRCESIKRKREPDHARTTGPAAWSLGVAGLLAACTQGPGGGGIGLASGQDPDPGDRRFPDLLHPSPDPRGPGQRHARASVRRGRRLFRHAVEARPRLAGRPGNRAHRPPARRPAGRAGRPLRHQGSRRRARRPARGLRHARPARRFRRGRTADLEHLGIQHRDRHAASRDHLGHHRRGRPGRRAGLSTRRPHPVLLDAPAPGQGHPARRGQGAVRSGHRSAQRVRVRAARDERRRHRHPPDLLQPEQRPVSAGAAERPRAVHALGSRAGPRRIAPVHRRTPTAPTCSCTTARCRT